MGLVAAFVLSIFTAQAMNCRLPDKPVQDQDGLGICYANVASLMMEHNLGLQKTPSYIQLSIAASAHRGTRFLSMPDGKEHLFNSSGFVCHTFNQTKLEGYCDAETFRWDAVGRKDAQHKQERFLKDLGKLLDNNGEKLGKILNASRQPAERERLIRQLSGCFQHHKEFCGGTEDEFMAKRFFTRLYESLKQKLASLGDRSQTLAIQDFLQQTFDQNGSPTPAAKNFFLRDFVPGDREKLRTLEPELAASQGIMSEEVFQVWWRNRLNLKRVFDPVGPKNNYGYMNDIQARRFCAKDKQMLLNDFLLSSCAQLPATIDRRMEHDVRLLLGALEQSLNEGAIGLRGMIGLMSPACEKQMGTRAGKPTASCANYQIKDEKTKTRAISLARSQLCTGRRSIGVTLCTGFFRSATPVDSSFCTNNQVGVPNHGKHAVTLVGTRTQSNGKNQFLVQNSWGPTCPFSQKSKTTQRPIDHFVECEMTKNEVPTGRFWVDEDLLFNNSIYVHVIQ